MNLLYSLLLFVKIIICFELHNPNINNNNNILLNNLQHSFKNRLENTIHNELLNNPTFSLTEKYEKNYIDFLVLNKKIIF